MANIILFQPELQNSIFNTENPGLPLGLLTVASILHKKYKVKIIDQRIDNNWKDNLSKEFKKKPIIFGTTAITGNEIIGALEASKFVKENSDVPVVWGGTHISLLPQQTLNNEYIDYGIVGEGEITFFELVEAIKNNKPLKNIRGLCYKKDGRVIVNKERKFINLNKIPALPLHLVNPKDYLGKDKLLGIMSSRGCLNNCAYCYNYVFNKCKWRGLSKRKLCKRIKQYINLGVEKLFFSDDNAMPSIERIKELCLVLNNFKIEWGSTIDFQTLSELNLNELNMLKRSGCTSLMVGIETIPPKLRKLINKQIVDPIKVLKLNLKLKKVGIWPIYNFIFGLPGETISDIRQNTKLILRLVKENPNCVIIPFIYTPYPGTNLFRLEDKKNIPKNLIGWSNFNREVYNINNEKRKRLTENIVYAIQFINNGVERELRFHIYKKLFRFYKGIAKFRMNNLFFSFYVERRIFKLVKNMILTDKN